MITVQFEAATYAEIIKQMKDFVGAPTPVDLKDKPQDVGFVKDRMRAHTQEKVEQEEAKQAKKKTKKKAAKKVEAPTEGVTADQCVASLQEVVAKAGLEVGRDILKHFDVTRMSEVPKEKYGEFLEACTDALASTKEEA